MDGAAAADRVRLRPALLLLPVLGLVTAVILVPELWALGISFTNFRLGQPVHLVGVANYAYHLSEPNFWNAASVNALFVLGAVTAEMALGLGIALVLARGFRWQNLWIALILAPMAISPAVSGVIWKYLLNFNIGPVNYLLGSIGLERQQWLTSLSLALPSVILVEVWLSVPQVILFLYPARITFPKEFYEAAAIDGASGWQMLRHITLPLLLPAFFLALVFRLIFSIRAFGVVWLLTAGGPLRETELLAIYMFKEGFQNFRFGSAAAVAWMMLVITMLAASYLVYRMYHNAFVAQSPR